MMTRKEAVEHFCQWFDDGCIGNVFYFRSPRAAHVDSVVEETVKLKEFDMATRDAVERVFDLLDAEKMEFFRNRDGNPDRVKFTRR
jgi:hypothetical protein